MNNSAQTFTMSGTAFIGSKASNPTRKVADPTLAGSCANGTGTARTETAGDYPPPSTGPANARVGDEPLGRTMPYEDRLVIHTDEPKRYGISRHDLNKRRIKSVFPGVLIVPGTAQSLDAPTWADQHWKDTAFKLRALQLLHPDVAADGLTAAVILGYPLPDYARPEALTVSRAHDGHRIRQRDVALIRTVRYAPTDVLGILVNRPEYVLTRLGPHLRSRDLIAVIDCMAGSWHGPATATVSQISSVLAEKPRLQHRAKLLRAVAAARDRVRSPQETYLRLFLVARGLPEPTVSLEVTTLSGGTREIDLAFEHQMVAVEYHGRQYHFANARQVAEDNIRRRELEELGWTVIVVTSEFPWSLYCDQIRSALLAAGRRP